MEGALLGPLGFTPPCTLGGVTFMKNTAEYIIHVHADKAIADMHSVECK